jgi:hypothetical protein
MKICGLIVIRRQRHCQVLSADEKHLLQVLLIASSCQHVARLTPHEMMQYLSGTALVLRLLQSGADH